MNGGPIRCSDQDLQDNIEKEEEELTSSDAAALADLDPDDIDLEELADIDLDSLSPEELAALPDWLLDMITDL